jgi:hypothetical protein
MAGRIHHLKQEIIALEDKVTQFAETLRNQYQSYLELLSQSVYQQSILASYQICTQKYPQEFLDLSFSQRQNVQEEIKMIGKSSKEKLSELLDKKHKKSTIKPINLLEEMLLGIETTEESETSLLEEENTLENSANHSNIKNPDDLLEWSKNIEKGIIQVLDQLSMELNHHLQKLKILPTQLPKQVLDMAIKAEDAEQPTGNNPNLLDVLIEAENKQENEDRSDNPVIHSQITKLIAIHLRLPEIEFSEPGLSLQRKQIRNLLEQIAQLRKQYHKKQKECAIAEAESAWRASWYE